MTTVLQHHRWQDTQRDSETILVQQYCALHCVHHVVKT